MGFGSYRGGFKVGAGFKPDGDSGFPLIESCDIQVTEEGMRLDEYLANLVVGENLDPEIAEQESLVDLIKDALQEKASNPGAGGGILKIEKTSASISRL